MLRVQPGVPATLTQLTTPFASIFVLWNVSLLSGSAACTRIHSRVPPLAMFVAIAHEAQHKEATSLRF